MKHRAQRKPLIFSLYVLAMLSFSSGTVASARHLECASQNHNTHNTFSYLLVDRSEHLKDTAPLEQVFSSIKDNSYRDSSGERLIIGVITEKVAKTRIIMDRVWPQESVWENRLMLIKKKKDFGRCLEKLEKGLMQQMESHKGSAIIETLSFISKVFQSDPAKNKRLIIFSDMVQNSGVLSFYRNSGSAPVDTQINIIKKEQLLPSFNGVKVYVAGVGGTISDKRARKVEKFWKRYFELSGANLRFYGPLLPGL